jgi:hypothetical protein
MARRKQIAFRYPKEIVSPRMAIRSDDLILASKYPSINRKYIKVVEVKDPVTIIKQGKKRYDTKRRNKR